MSAGFNDAGKTTLADGAAVTSSNTGVSGNTNVTPVGTAPVKRIDTILAQILADTGWYETSTTAGVTSYLSMTPGGYVAATGGAIGAWVMCTANPSSNMQIMRYGNSGANYIGLSTAGKLYLVVNSSVVHTAANAIPLNTPFWISHASNSAASNGISRMGWWNKLGVSQDSYSKTDGVTNAITAGTASVGRISSSGTPPIVRIACIRANSDASALIPPVIPMGSRGWGSAL